MTFLSFYLLTVPSHPRNITVHDVSSSSIKISWLEPERPNGPNLIYRIYYTSLNQTHLAMPKNDPENGMRSDAGVHYYTLKKLRKIWRVMFVKSESFLNLPSSFLFLFIGPFTEYRIVVVAITTRHDGNASIPIIQRTDVASPSAPIISNLACQKNGTILLRWKRPFTFNTIDYYIVSYKNVKWERFRKFQINASALHMETEVSNRYKTRDKFFMHEILIE